MQEGPPLQSSELTDHWNEQWKHLLTKVRVIMDWSDDLYGWINVCQNWICMKVKGIFHWIGCWDIAEGKEEEWDMGTYINFFSTSNFLFFISTQFCSARNWISFKNFRKKELLNMPPWQYAWISLYNFLRGYWAVFPYLSNLDLFLIFCPLDETVISLCLSSLTLFDWNGQRALARLHTATGTGWSSAEPYSCTLGMEGRFEWKPIMN